jgi:hypothetical protein
MLTFTTGKNDDGSCFARLGERNVCCVNDTEHGAIQDLLNYVAQLIDAGCLDSTGESKEEIDRRRYERIFPPTEPAK